jgi:hypothetical protein
MNFIFRMLGALLAVAYVQANPARLKVPCPGTDDAQAGTDESVASDDDRFTAA